MWCPTLYLYYGPNKAFSNICLQICIFPIFLLLTDFFTQDEMNHLSLKLTSHRTLYYTSEMLSGQELLTLMIVQSYQQLLDSDIYQFRLWVPFIASFSFLSSSWSGVVHLPWEWHDHPTENFVLDNDTISLVWLLFIARLNYKEGKGVIILWRYCMYCTLYARSCYWLYRNFSF